MRDVDIVFNYYLKEFLCFIHVLGLDSRSVTVTIFFINNI